MSGRPEKYDYTLKILNEALRKEESGLAYWKGIIDNPNAEPLSLRQAKGNISSNEQRVEELKKAILILSPQNSQ